MGIIQNAINQMWRTAGTAARLAPGYEQRQELYQEKKEYSKLQKLDKQLEEAGATEEHVKSLEQQVLEVDKASAQRAKKISLLEPTEQNITTAYRHEKYAENMEKALKEAAEKQEATRKQKEQSKAFWDLFTEGGKYK